jgi:hypothetical protein
VILQGTPDPGRVIDGRNLILLKRFSGFKDVSGVVLPGAKMLGFRIFHRVEA